MTVWEFVVGALAVVAAFIVYVASKVLAHLVGEEVEGRIDQIGYALLRLACKRLPAVLRENYYQEWAAELDAHILGATERPITRLYWGLRFPGSLLFKARSFACIQHPDAFTSKRKALEIWFKEPYSLRFLCGLGLSAVVAVSYGVVLGILMGNLYVVLGMLAMGAVTLYLAALAILIRWAGDAFFGGRPPHRGSTFAVSILSRAYPYSRLIRKVRQNRVQRQIS